MPNINQWQNPGYGLSVCTWIRLDNVENLNSSLSHSRRQLFEYVHFQFHRELFVLMSSWFCSLLRLHTGKGQGFEAFFLSDGTLGVSVTCKKEYTVVLVHNVLLNDQQWHSVAVSFNPSR